MSSKNTNALFKPDGCGRTKVHKAMLYGSANDVRALMTTLRNNNKIQDAMFMKDSCGGTPLQYAIYRSNEDILKVLRDYKLLSNRNTNFVSSPEFKSIENILYRAIKQKDNVPMRFCITYLFELYRKRNTTCCERILCVLREAIGEALKWRNLHAICFVQKNYLEGNKTLRKKFIHSHPYLLHRAIEFYPLGFKVLCTQKCDVCIRDNCGRNIFHIISERSSVECMKHIYTLFTEKKINANKLQSNTPAQSLVCNRSDYGILSSALRQVANYKDVEVVFTCVYISTNNGKYPRKCKVPCFLKFKPTFKRTPLEMAMYRYEFKILVWYAHIPCVRSIVRNDVIQKLSNMYMQYKDRKGTKEPPRYIKDLKCLKYVLFKTRQSDDTDLECIKKTFSSTNKIQKMKNEMPETYAILYSLLYPNAMNTT